MSRADMPVPVRGPVQSNANARRPPRGIRDSDDVPPVRATSGSRLYLPLKSTAAADTHSPSIPLARARKPVQLRSGADLFLPNAEVPEASALLRWRVAPAVAGIHDSSADRKS